MDISLDIPDANSKSSMHININILSEGSVSHFFHLKPSLILYKKTGNFLSILNTFFLDFIKLKLGPTGVATPPIDSGFERCRFESHVWHTVKNVIFSLLEYKHFKLLNPVAKPLLSY